MVERSVIASSGDLAAFSSDRGLPVSLGAQLCGLIEFGVGLGTLRPGMRLPSLRELADHLGVAPMTVAQVYADLVITFSHRRRDVMDLLPDTVVAVVTFIPAATTRQALAALDPCTRISLVSIFPKLAPLMKAGVQRFAPHLSEVLVAFYDTPELAVMLHQVDVVVFATGADDLGLVVPDGIRAFEYRHTPDAGDVRCPILPLLGNSSTGKFAVGEVA